jgi:Na+-driven multidrug efflux pump
LLTKLEYTELKQSTCGGVRVFVVVCRVRVANELGAGNGKGARFATIVSSVTSLVIGLFFWVLIVGLHDKFALIFTSSDVVLDAVDNLSVLLAFTILLNSIQPVLSGKVHTPGPLGLPFLHGPSVPS